MLATNPRPQPDHNIGDRRGEQQQGGQVPAGIAEIVRHGAAEHGWQIGEDAVSRDRTPDRTLEEQGRDSPKEQNRHPIIGRMQNSFPQRLRTRLAEPRRIGTRALFASPIAALWLLAACDQQMPPKGQVLAMVGDDALTKRDLQGELAAAARLGVRDDAPGPALDRLVERELLLRAARARELDLSPEYLAAIRRARADILIDMFNDQVEAQVPAPSAPEIASFIASRPWMFAGRQFLTVDEIVPEAGAEGVRAAEGAATIEEAAGRLAARKLAFRRRSMRVDSAQLPAADAAALLGAGSAPVALVGGAPARLAAVQAREPAAILGEQANKVADAVIRRERLARRLEAIVAKERRATQIRYREGFGPAAR